MKSNYKKIPNNFKNKEIDLNSKAYISNGLVGIYNMGNTCFINTGIN